MTSRLTRVRQMLHDQGLDAMIVTPSADLRYLTGYAAKPLERLTALLVLANADPVLLVPELEAAAARAAEVSMDVHTWAETDDPFDQVAALVGEARRIGVDNEMWASRVFALQSTFPEAQFSTAGELVSELRMRKSPQEIAHLGDAAAAIDRVHAQMSSWLTAGRTEREVGADIARAILDEGHDTVDFVIVGSGPNGASPHHEVSDRRIEVGDPVVVDIGGTTASGYCSDSTRTYVVGDRVPAEFMELYSVLQAAQEAQRNAARPGITASELDAVGRRLITDAGYGNLFIHRTGHGIGQQTHEEPYIVDGSDVVLEPGMAFSIEPGIYVPDTYGARIEDIVVCTANGADTLNHSTRELVLL